MNLPFATGELPGTGGQIKVVPEDFRVDEIPAYLPGGEGEHLFVRVEKRGRNTHEVVRELAHALSVRERDAGVAGQKDRHALTTQWISLAGVAKPTRAEGLAGEGWRVLEAALHANKLRLGHLRGNRFTIRVRGAREDAPARAQAVASALRERGLPNYYGPQRFGRFGDNAEVGRLILSGSDDPRVRAAHRDPRKRRFFVSAFQSECFNRVLAARIAHGTWARPLEGDVLQKLGSGGLFVCEDPTEDAPRVASFELSITGPMPGSRMRPQPRGVSAELEASILASTGVGLPQLAASPDAQGARRALRLPVEVGVEADDEGLLLRFELPAGAYATSVLREITKAESSPEQDAS